LKKNGGSADVSIDMAQLRQTHTVVEKKKERRNSGDQLMS
jgi:hypothetical protein